MGFDIAPPKSRSLQILRLGWDMLAGVQDLLWPPECIVCKVAGDNFLCSSCKSIMISIQPPLCSRCGYPGSSAVCPSCGDAPWTRRSPCDAMRQVSLYDGVCREAILAYKEHGMKCLADELGLILIRWLDSASVVWREFDAVVAVPGRRIRAWSLGYHHAHELAIRVASHLELPMIQPIKRLSGPDLASLKLTRTQRIEAANASYALKPKADDLYGKQILVIDDIVTTGATANAVARQLKLGGADKVRLLALARTPLH